MPTFRSGKPYCLLTLSGLTSHTAGQHQVPFDVAVEDPVGQADGAGGVTIDRDGLYMVSYGVGRNSVASTSVVNARAFVGAVILSGSNGPSTTSAVIVSGARTEFLEAGDVVTLQALLHTSITADFATLSTYLSVVRVGPVRWT